MSSVNRVTVSYEEYKQEDEHLENANVLARPARFFTAREEDKLYRKVQSGLLPSLSQDSKLKNLLLLPNLD